VAGAASVVGAFAYEGAARSLILDLKLRHQRISARPLIDGMVAEVRRHGLVADVVTWVPGRLRDVLDRGFDHAKVLALGIASGVGLPSVRLLKRCRRSPDQASLSRDDRLTNLRGVFTAAPCEGAAVALVDDLLTTGATASACCRALLAAGASSVEVVTACRA
jgi:predicted amidophosphoribosyltransferase